MKKLLLLLLFISSQLLTNAQTCTPAWGGGGSKSDGIRPNSAQNLPFAKVGVPYSATVQIKVPKDSMLGGYPVTIDSIVLTSFTGLPSSLSYKCNPANCSFPGGDSGCVEISGTPTLSEIGVYHLKGYVTTWVNNGLIAVPDSVTYFVINVDTSSGIDVINRNYFDAGQNYPNPVNASTNIDFNLPISGNVQFEVYNLLGAVLYKQVQFYKSGSNLINFNASNLANGIYFYTLSDGINTLTYKMIVNK